MHGDTGRRRENSFKYQPVTRVATRCLTWQAPVLLHISSDRERSVHHFRPALVRRRNHGGFRATDDKYSGISL
jgi:hypothetical protein